MKAVTFAATAFAALVLPATAASAHDSHISADCDQVSVEFARFPDLPNTAEVKIGNERHEVTWTGRSAAFTFPSPEGAFRVAVRWDTNGHTGQAVEQFDLADCVPVTTTTVQETTTTTTAQPTTTTQVAPTTAPSVPPDTPTTLAKRLLAETGSDTTLSLYGVALVVAGSAVCLYANRLRRA